MLHKSLLQFCNRRDEYKRTFQQYLKKQTFDKNDCQQVLQELGSFLMRKACTGDIAECFPQYLIVILSITIEIRSNPLESSVVSFPTCTHRKKCFILGKLISLHPDVLGFTLRYFENHPAPFETIRNESKPVRKRSKTGEFPLDDDEPSDYDIVKVTLNILKAAPNHFKQKWKWSLFYHFLTHKNKNLQWHALKCIGIVLNMSEAMLVECAKTLIADFDRFTIDTQEENEHVIITAADDDTKGIELAVASTDSVVSVAGILLPIFNRGQHLKSSSLVAVPSMELNLRCLALAVAARKCVCLQGPVGCGKTAMVEYLANVTGRGPSDIIKVQLGDQTDSKMLLGTYRCTDVPGEFVWQPGVLTQAVMSDKWLLLEDIDSAALDVASVLSNLMETRTLSVPGYRDIIYAKCGFQLFVTQRLITTASGSYRQSTGASNLLEKHWLCVNMDPLSKEELVTIVKTLFPELATISTRIVDVFLLFSMSNQKSDSLNENIAFLRTGRLTSTRDLIKWCTRAIVDYDVASPESALKVFQDAIDIFCCSVPDQSLRLDLAGEIALKLGIVKTKADYFVNKYKPSVTLESRSFVAGRAKVYRKNASFVQFNETKVNFSFTRPSSILLERVTSCVAQKEPVLLVGETGTGKTSSVQYLAKCTGHKLIVINMNQQSESADLLGGYKPVDIKLLITPIREEFEILFRSYYAIEPNRKFLEHIANCYKTGRWKTLITLMCHSAVAAVKRLKGKIQDLVITTPNNPTRKRIRQISTTEDEKLSAKNDLDLVCKWEKILIKLEKFKSQVKSECSLAFAFIEGSLIKALKEGHWVLLDEINLASSETLECLSGLLEGSAGSLSLLERGDNESVTRHPDFTMFACMNPATDVGKKELPVGLRNRFTEFYVDELTESNDLFLLINSYLADMNLPSTKIESIVKFYSKVKKEANNSLNDGTGHKPHYSLRTLCRALSIAASNPCGNVLRSLYEAFCLSFLTQLDHVSYPIVQRMITESILDNKTMRAVISTPIPKPSGSDEHYINFQGYWVVKGNLKPEVPKNYILTASVCRNLKDLVRVVAIGKIPVLLQGDTSVGKTSLITYLAKASGHVCVRINNHEHTDLQEYVGSYVADESGKLVFKEGVLVEAMRRGHWIILDELNLAPSDVLEALNRVLDDNRELFIPETQETIKAHSNFMLFATQNPPGVYGGRKVLSRAFRNRFVELHFDEIPSIELETILHERCKMPPSYCKKVIQVMTDLQLKRKTTAAFAGKQGFITLRDLFKWGERYRLAPEFGEGTDRWQQHSANEGYLVLAAKVRKPEECEEIRRVIKNRLNCDVDPSTLFTLNDKTSPVTKSILERILNNPVGKFQHVVWTYHMRRMAVLVAKSCQFKEPVLLVGETGCGKTTVCQLAAAMKKRELYSVNCHMHTESSDFLGNLRPVRSHTDSNNQKLFEWVDGPLVTAMRTGDYFLADEISLADDSVLERMNSLLEPERSLLLAEKTTDSTNPDQPDNIITAHEDFCFIGTMNPGGDYGKKELSPALRNRFTEIWCEECSAEDDLQAIIEHNLNSRAETDNTTISKAILKFVDWLRKSEIGKRFTVSIRDIMTWVNFINACDGRCESRLSASEAFFHGGCLTYIDSLGSGATGTESTEKLEEFRKCSIKFLQSQSEKMSENFMNTESTTEIDENTFGLAPFFIPRGSSGKSDLTNFTFTAPTTKSNILKVLRGLQLQKPLLLEGSPGVGKTSLVSAIAKASGHKLLRINLSDQTDISDLFGADLPMEGGIGGQFAWKDGPFLQALRAGDWILLDELNLASQSVLEGLNACFDHRGEIYIPELGRTFTVKSGTKLFGCQNPLRQGGARRGLPKSFLNRFTQVFVETLSADDLRIIAQSQFPHLNRDLIGKIIDFNSRISSEAGILWGHSGSPWEMNLRDIIRWCELINVSMNKLPMERNLASGMELIYANRMRTTEDKEKVREIYDQVFGNDSPVEMKQPLFFISDDHLYFDHVALPRTKNSFTIDDHLLVMREQLPALRSLAHCIEMNWMPILIGGAGTGKTSMVRVLAQLTGQKLQSVVVNSAMDTTEILGGFEQTDYNRHLEALINATENLLINITQQNVSEDLKKVSDVHGLLEEIRHSSASDENASSTMTMATEFFLRRTEELHKLISAMKTLELSRSTELIELEDKLRKLSALVQKDKCLNAGGKFEWVNSVLVKCLQDGHWLLLDQVNLCSPAVLDRLNGLLEPGGMLTIGERGVDNDGNIHTIKPHENFRLFLTMDPRYGEISRAMRNRGVEIYLPSCKDNLGIDNLDIKSQLFSIGLKNADHQEALLKIHRNMSENNFSAEIFGVIELFHAAFLINQQVSRGFSVIEAFKMAITDVYIKSKNIQDSGIRDSLTLMIDETINQYNSTEKRTPILDLNTVTLRVADLQEYAAIALIKQETSLLELLFNERSSANENDYPATIATTKFINDFLNSSRNDANLIDIEIDEILPYLLINFYEKSTINDICDRTRYILKSITGPENNSFITKIDLLKSEIQKCAEKFSDHSLPWHPLFSPIEPSDDQLTSSLKLAMTLYLKAMNIGRSNNNIKQCLEMKQKTISVDTYSKAIHNKKLADRLNMPLVTMFFAFAEKLSSWSFMYLQEVVDRIDYKKYIDLRRSFQWVRRFYQQGDLVLIDKTDAENSKNASSKLDDVETLLKIHYKWMKKFIHETISYESKADETAKIKFTRETIATLLQEIDVNVYSVDDRFQKFTRMIKRNVVTPLPFKSEPIITSYKKLKSITKDMSPIHNMLQFSALAWETRLILLHFEENLKQRNNLIEAWTKFSNEEFDNPSIFSETISHAENLRDQYHLSLCTRDQISDAVQNILRTQSDRNLKETYSKIQLYPVYEYAFFLFANKFHSMACKKMNIHDVTNRGFVSDSSLFKFVDIPSISMSLIGVMKAICNNPDDPIKLTRLANELFRGLTRLSENSNAFKSPDSMIKFSEITEETLEQLSMEAEVTAPVVHATSEPILIMLISNLILDNSSTSNREQTILGSAALGNYKSKVKQLKTLNDILWRNSIAFNSKEFKYTFNDREALVSYSENYIKAVEKIGGEMWERDVLQSSKVHTVEADLKYHKEYRNPLDELKLHINELKSQEGLEFETIKRGFAWVLLGYHQLFIFTNLEFIDPVQKTDLKIKYTDEDIQDLKNMIYGIKLDSYAFGDHEMNEYDPRISEGRRCLEKLKLRKEELVALKGFRSVTMKYVELVREMIDFRETIGSWNGIVEPIKNLYDISTGAKTDSNENAEIFIEKINERIGSIEISQRSLHEFSERIEMKFLSNYREIVAPILTSVAEVNHGSKVLLDEVKRLVAERKNNAALNLDVGSFMHNLIRFPTIGTEQKNLLQLIDLCTSQNTRRFIDANINATCSMDSLIEQFRMLKNGLNELYNHVSLTKQLTQPLWVELNALLQQVVILWQKKEMEKERAAAEEASLYKNKATVHAQTLSEEEEITAELRNLFPTHREDDFNEIDVNDAQLDTVSKKGSENTPTKEYVHLITEEDIHEVHQIHARIVESFVPAPWLNTTQVSGSRSYIEPLVQRFYTFAKIRPSVESALTLELSSKLYTSFNVLTSVATSLSQGEAFSKECVNYKKSYDFYKNSNIEEVKQCLPILEAITIKVNCLLQEWPEHPTLRWIIIIIQRINKFTILSPVSRFLTGLELLLVKMREWEENAHSGVSLAEYSTSLIQQIIDWRKLELNCWKDCLNTAFERLEAKTSKWWFFIYAVVESYINKSPPNIEIPDGSNENLPDEEITAKDLIERLEIFMNQSPLVEFQARLNLLHTFHAHAFYFKSGKQRDELLAIFWNIYNYYKQFAGDVQNKIKSLKAPIEKKLKDFVKIARWNDINYWSVKETIEKTHRTLHKFIREFEIGLKQLVGTLLIVRSSSNLIDSNVEECTRSKDQGLAIDVNDFIISEVVKGYDSEIPSDAENSLVPKLGRLVAKAKQLCKKTILMSSYPGLRTELEEFIEDCMNHSIQLKNMDIDRTLPKGKQKSHAKSILQQKKMALADYFKNLTNMGVSYRKGFLAWKNHPDSVVNMTVPPLEVFVSLKQLANLDKVDKRMMTQWDGCQIYYYKSLIKLNALNSALTKAQNDLGTQNMDRCSGYSNHLMILAHDQKIILADSFSNFLYLKQKIAHFGMIDSNTVRLPAYEQISDSADDLKSVLITLQTGLEQLELYLRACPEDNHVEGNIENFQLETVSVPAIQARKGDQVWESTNSYLKKSKKMVETLSQEYDNLFSRASVSVVRTSAHFNFLTKSCHTLINVYELLADCGKTFGDDHPVSDIFKFIGSNVQEWITKCKSLSNDHEPLLESKTDNAELNAKVEEFIKTILLVIQEKYKEASSEDSYQSPEQNNEKDDENEDDEEKEKTQLEENGLHGKLIDSLKKDIKNLRLQDINEKLDDILITAQLMDDASFVPCNRVLLRCLPLLKQYSLFAQFYLSEKVASFRTTCKLLNLQLNVFLDLVTNGFCVPKDLDLEEGDTDQDGVEQKDAKGGMGLGDGEGQKDMSDQIESEDQLEDARPADEEKKSEEDKDCKEEENGIDMSENFESKLQDMDNNEDDDDNNDEGDDDKDLDKEMGETEDGVDQLDKEIWGDDEEKEEEEENIDSDEQGKGEQTGEKEMSGKDDSEDQKNKKEDDENREIDQDEEKEEINEINEPDVNDDQVNPYHGKQEPPPEPEAMDLPDDLNLDNEDEGKEDKGQEDNPFDIDEMKESTMPPEIDEPENHDDEKVNGEDEHNEDSTDDEDEGSTTADPGMKDLDEIDDPEESDNAGQPSNQDDEEEKKEEEGPDDENKEEQGEDVAPSRTDTTGETNDQEQFEDKSQGSRDKISGQSEASEKQESTPTENNYDDGKDNGSGQAQAEELDDGHSGATVAKRASTQSQKNDQKQEKRKTPGERDDNHALVDNVQPEKKKQKMISKGEEMAQDDNDQGIENDEDSEMDMCQHVKDSEVSDGHAMDAATDEQLKTQQITDSEEEQKQNQEEDAMDVDMHEDAEEIEDYEDVKPLESTSEVPSKSDKEKSKPSGKKSDDQTETQTKVDVEGEVVGTSGVKRSTESAFYTNLVDSNEIPTSSMQVERTRIEVQNMLSQWTRSPLAEEALMAWNCLSVVTESPARDLSEKLRLVLEPTQATRLKGDYRTGKRINMRKIIPYVASQFRKDKIWLRRTKPSKRDYQIILAVDDSKSMKDNQSKELAFESLSLISKAMEYLEVGQLGVVSFGEQPKVLHPLGEPFNEQSGSRLMQELRFEQKETRVHSLVNFTVDMFESQVRSNDNARLMLILSDGRNINSQGANVINRAVRRAKLANIFIVFIIVEDQNSEFSVLDTIEADVQNGKLIKRPYMDSFPFPFYMILKDITALPGVLSDALRQWFEIVGKIDN